MNVALGYSMPLSGANEQDAANVVRRLTNATLLYRSAVKELVEHYIENLPMDRAKHVKSALRTFHVEANEAAEGLAGHIKRATERE